MLDKIKTLKELLMTDAIKLDIPIDEYIVEWHTEEERFDFFTKQLKKYIDSISLPINFQAIKPLIDHVNVLNYIKSYFHVNCTESKYTETLKHLIEESLAKEIKNNNSRSISHPYFINIPGITVNGISLKMNDNEDQEFYKKRIERSFKDQSVLNYLINVLDIKLKTEKYQIMIIDGQKEFKKWTDTIKREFNIENWIEDRISAYVSMHIDEYGKDSFVSSPQYVERSARLDEEKYEKYISWPTTGWYYTMNAKYKRIGHYGVSDRKINYNANIHMNPNNFGWTLDSLEADINFLKSNIEKIQEANQIIDDIYGYYRKKGDEIKRKTKDLYGSTKIAKLNTRQAQYEMSVLQYEHATELLNHPRKQELSKIIGINWFDRTSIFLNIFSSEKKVKSYYYRTKSQEVHLLKLKKSIDSILELDLIKQPNPSSYN